MKGNLFVVSAPSGAGKTSLVKALIESFPDVHVSVSHTTRAKRPGEVDGKDYHFVSKQQFDEIRDRGGFLESADVFDHCYGTSRVFVENLLGDAGDVLLEIDWQGAEQVRRNMPGAISIFILPPSLALLEQRLRGRGQDSEGTIARRLREAANDIKHCKDFDFIIMNDQFEVALQDMQSIFRASRLRRDQQLTRFGAQFDLA